MEGSDERSCEGGAQQRQQQRPPGPGPVLPGPPKELTAQPARLHQRTVPASQERRVSPDRATPPHGVILCSFVRHLGKSNTRVIIMNMTDGTLCSETTQRSYQTLMGHFSFTLLLFVFFT